MDARYYILRIICPKTQKTYNYEYSLEPAPDCVQKYALIATIANSVGANVSEFAELTVHILSTIYIICFVVIFYSA